MSIIRVSIDYYWRLASCSRRELQIKKDTRTRVSYTRGRYMSVITVRGSRTSFAGTSHIGGMCKERTLRLITLRILTWRAQFRASFCAVAHLFAQECNSDESPSTVRACVTGERAEECYFRKENNTFLFKLRWVFNIAIKVLNLINAIKHDTDIFNRI